MTKFIIEVKTLPRSIHHELATHVKEFPTVAVNPIMQENETEYGMYQELAI